jgi:hypothetical protein
MVTEPEPPEGPKEAGVPFTEAVQRPDGLVSVFTVVLAELPQPEAEITTASARTIGRVGK